MKKRRQGLFVKSFSVLITFIILGLLVLSGPAQAFIISLDITEDIIAKGGSISFIGEIDIETGENLPIENMELFLSGPENVNCLFYPNGTIISGCKGLSIDYLGNASLEYGNGYGYYGYGYNFGYGYGYMEGKLTYNFTLNTTDYLFGNYSTKLTSYIDGNDFSKEGDDILIAESVNITDLPSLPGCAYETDNITLSANITGNIVNVTVEANISGNLTNYTTTNLENVYSTVVNGIGGENLTWRFIVEDVFGDLIYGDWNDLYIVRRTSLSVNPPSPNGLNNWYVVEPTWTLSNPDASQLWYRWNGDPRINYTETGPFGLENIANLDKQSAGTVKLRISSETVCGLEEWEEEVFYIDLTDPLITDLFPENNSEVNNLRPSISAYLDEVYQSNSGIDESSIIMKVDGVEVSPIVTEYDNLDRRVVYNPSSDLSVGEHEAYVYVMDKSGRASELSWKFVTNVTSLINLTVYSPEDAIYDSKRALFNITTEREVEKIEYINYADNRPRWRTLCRRCNEYGFDRKKTKTLREGENNITIKATNEFDFVEEKNISIMVDSKKPRISRTTPKRNAIINGSNFYLKLREDYLKHISMVIEFNGSKDIIPLDVNNCVQDRSYKGCNYDFDLTVYDGKQIEYYFIVKDSINQVESRKTKVWVDTTPPELDVYFPEDDFYGRKVPFNITVSEKVLIEYYNPSDRNARWRRLTSNKDEYGNTRFKTKTFKRGMHDLQIRATDKAGNSDIDVISFEVDY
jgi:hypothetical protein